MVFQSYSLFPNMNALNNVAYGLRMRRQRSPSSERRRRPSCSSWSASGTRRRSTPTRCREDSSSASHSPERSPSSLGCCCSTSRSRRSTRRSAAELRDQIRALQQRLAITTVFVTHDQEEALSMADRVCVMSSGRNEQTATPATLVRASRDRLRRRVRRRLEPGPRRAERQRGRHLRPALPDPQRRHLQRRRAAIDALLRPEDVAIEVDPSAKGFVIHRSFLGATTRLIVQVGEIPVRVDVRSEVAGDIDPGTHVSMKIISRDVLVAPRLAQKPTPD